MVLSVDCEQITQLFQAELNRCFFNQLQVDIINNNNPSLVFLEFSNCYIIAMTLITRKRFILETFSYTAVIVQEMTELFTFCDKSIKLCMIPTRHVTNNSDMDPG